MTRSDPVGVAETPTVRLFAEDAPLHLVRGGTLSQVSVAYETYGTLNDARENTEILCHALTGDAHAAGYQESATRDGWWDNMIGPGRPPETKRLYGNRANLLGG